MGFEQWSHFIPEIWVNCRSEGKPLLTNRGPSRKLCGKKSYENLPKSINTVGKKTVPIHNGAFRILNYCMIANGDNLVMCLVLYKISESEILSKLNLL